MRTRRIFILLTAAAVICSAVPAFAQQAAPGGRFDDMPGFDNQPGRGGRLSEEKREEIRKKIEAVRIWKLTEALKLDENTAAKLSAFLSTVDQHRRDIMREQMETMRELRQTLSTGKPEEPKLKAAIDKLEKNRHAMAEIRSKEIAGLKNILTTEQQARFLIFQQEFRRDIQRMISGARGNGPGRGGMRAGQGHGPGPGPRMGVSPEGGDSARPPQN